MANRNRTAGHRFELETIAEFKRIGFPHVVSSRSESRSRDADKIDLVNKDEGVVGRFPFNVQCKTYASKLDYETVLKEMKHTLGIPSIVVNKRTKKVGTRFMEEGRYAFMFAEDLYNLIEENLTLKRKLNESSNRCG